MPDLSLFSEKQRHALRLLYQSGKRLSVRELADLGCSISPLDLKAMTTEQYGKAVILYGDPFNGTYLISAEGRGIHEALQRQQADEAYRRDYDAKALEIAKAAQGKAALANWLSLAALLASIAAVVATVWAELRS